MWNKLIISKNNLFFYFLLVCYIFGVILYDYIDFRYTDELMVLFLFFFTTMIIHERKKIEELYPLLILFVIFIFYTIYSFIIRSNVPAAILQDMFICIKPFLAFYCTYLLLPTLTEIQKYVLTIVSLIIALGLIIIGLTDNMTLIFGHVSRFATAAICTAFLYFYCSGWKWADIIVFIIILSIGFFSTRSKFYGFWGIAIFLTIYYKLGKRLHLDLKGLFSICIIIAVAIILAWEKMTIYYIDGMRNTESMWSRPIMIYVAWQILNDYIPFGCGLGSFGTFSSAIWYSPTYTEYQIDQVWGLSKAMPDFICDAFYPSIAQFGWVGVILYILFWKDFMKKGTKLSTKPALMVVLTFFFFLIEGTADMTLTHNRGIFILIMAGLFITSEQTKQEIVK